MILVIWNTLVTCFRSPFFIRNDALGHLSVSQQSSIAPPHVKTSPQVFAI